MYGWVGVCTLARSNSACRVRRHPWFGRAGAYNRQAKGRSIARYAQRYAQRY